jgi:hypothetical protein
VTSAGQRVAQWCWLSPLLRPARMHALQRPTPAASKQQGRRAVTSRLRDAVQGEGYQAGACSSQGPLHHVPSSPGQHPGMGKEKSNWMKRTTSTLPAVVHVATAAQYQQHLWRKNARSRSSMPEKMEASSRAGTERRDATMQQRQPQMLGRWPA